MIIIYHNPRCSKSREALALLQQDSNKQLTIVEYLKTPPSAAMLREILTKLQLPARALLRKKETEYTELALDNPELTEQQLIDAMAAHPKLIERPIVINGQQAAIGRPLSNISAIIG
tara:strand:- start:453 stop:803 length:351 start_codon:yes stop_codon:yes gene_type:complete